jgi:type VI protein secretion system component Hcp
MAVDMFIKIGDLKGEAQDEEHENEIDVLIGVGACQIAAQRMSEAAPAPER